MSASRRFLATRDRLLRLREDLAAAQREFTWPQFGEFNWASDYFDVVACDNDQPALRVVDDAGNGDTLSFAQLSRRSSQVANWLSSLGIGHGDRILIMLGNVLVLWETMLAAIRIGAVIIPATTLLENEDLAEIRDGYGQTETAALIGNPPGQPLKPGSMGRPLPGYSIVLRDTDGRLQEEVDLTRHPLSLMQGYLDDPEGTAGVMRDGCYHTGDVAQRDSDGYLTYVGRMDDVFKSSDYRISPFELESVLIEHLAVAEAAVVPSSDPLRLCVPKAFVTLVAGYHPDAETAHSIFAHIRARMSAYKRIRRLEFKTLPKTISGKIRRVELRNAELAREPVSRRNPHEFWEEDFAEAAPIVPRPPPV